MEPDRQQSTLPEARTTLPVVPWKEINSAGAYVEEGTGDLYRIPSEALGPASPIIAKESRGASRFVKVSPNPYVTLHEARLAAANENIVPNF